MTQHSIYLINNMIIIILVLLMSLISTAFLTLFERKILSFMHYRKGPNKVGYWGIIQPFSDAMKLLTKEYFFPMKSNYLYYSLSPFIMFILIMLMWIIYPFSTNLFNWNLNSLFFLSIMSMGVYGLMISGWSSNSSFSMIGAIRSIAQSISYEVTFAISLLLPLLMINSLNFNNLSIFNKFYLMIMMFWPSMLILFISMLAEVNRTPFDLSEGESELVSGFNIEYSSHSFTLIFLAEYASILFMMFLFSWMNFFFNNLNLMFYLMTIMLTYIVIWMRSTFPRIRYDYLMFLCWFYLLPYILLIFMIFLMFIKMPMLISLNYFY